jgi:hypothetical protein
MRRFVLLGAFLIGSVSTAYAGPVTGQISIAGYAEAVGSSGMGAATGIQFATGSAGTFSGASGGLTSFGAGTGSFAGLACSNNGGGCGTIQNISNFATEPATTSFLTLTTGGPSVSFDLTTVEAVSHTSDAQGGSLVFTASGILDFSGYGPTSGTFTFTADGSSVVPFSATLVAGAALPPVPEPASLSIFGVAVLGLAASRGRRPRI